MLKDNEVKNRITEDIIKLTKTFISQNYFEIENEY